jgi:hypothetical protein
MQDLSHTLLSVPEVARRWRLSARTIRDRIKAGELPAVRRKGQYLVCAADMWAREDGRLPHARDHEHHLTPLLNKRDLASRARASVRTVERWVAEGLPTRNVDTNVRFDEEQARIWLRGRFGFELPRQGKTTPAATSVSDTGETDL